MEDVVNPAVPTTTGALLAEEWTINPMATLPSFMEMFMMDEAARSAQKSLDTGLGLLQRRLESQAAHHANIPDVQDDLGSSTNISLSRIRALLQRASAKISSYLAHTLQTFGPEISSLILYAMERHCLRSACATISESLYGGRQAKLERIQNGKSTNNQRKLLPLSDRDKTRLALLVALGPYLRHRMLLWYQKLRQQSTTTTATSSTSILLQKVHKLFVWAYPLLHVSLSSLDLVYQWRYLLGHSVFFHPYAQYLGLVVRRVTQEDSRGGSSESNNPNGVKNVNTLGSPSSSASAPPSPLRKAAVLAVSMTIVLSWISHFRSEYQRQREEQIMIQQQQQRQDNASHSSGRIHHNAINHSIANNHIPPPPSSGVAKHALPSHLCPLCRHPRVNPTASPSGFVFCYKCLLNHVRANGKCPITERECTEDQLLRLYEPNAPTNTSVPERSTD